LLSESSQPFCQRAARGRPGRATAEELSGGAQGIEVMIGVVAAATVLAPHGIGHREVLLAYLDGDVAPADLVHQSAEATENIGLLPDRQHGLPVRPPPTDDAAIARPLPAVVACRAAPPTIRPAREISNAGDLAASRAVCV